MTPDQVFDDLCILYPKKWGDEAKVKWAKIYAKSLAGIAGPALADAFDKAIAAQKLNTPPTVADIRAHLLVPSAAPKEFNDSDMFPYRSKAHALFKTDASCKQAVADGWGLGLWEFIGKKGHAPNMAERKHLIDTNELFHRQYEICGTSETIAMDLPQGRCDIRVEEKFRAIYEKQIEKRNRITETYG